MSRFLGVLVSLLLAATLHAQNFDLQVSLEAPDEVEPGDTFTVRGTVLNAGPDDVAAVTIFFGKQLTPCVDALRIDALLAGQSRTFECSITAQTPPYRIKTSIFATSVDRDRDTSNNYAEKSTTIHTPPDVQVLPNGIANATPGLPVDYNVRYSNLAVYPATGVTVTVTAPGEIVAAPPQCTVDGSRAVCAVGTLVEMASGNLQFKFRAPDVSETTFTVTAGIAASEADADPGNNVRTATGRTYRTFFVTNTADAGDGSLRAAIEGANSCADFYPCQIAFRIPPAGERWQTIRVGSPLPRVTAMQLQLDGTTERAYFGDTNPDGPEIELTGSESAGNGIEFAVPCYGSVRGLVINGFPGAGVLGPGAPPCAGGGGRAVDGNYLGTDPTGMRAIPNERGVRIMGSQPAWQITNNVISGNRHSGIYLDSGQHSKITGNIIGLNAPLTAGLGNGASGVYITPGARATDLRDNYIGFNHHFGVAIAAGTTNVAMFGNSFQANYGMAIDYELDGIVSNNPIPVPEITSVRFEDGKTIVEGRSTVNGTFATTINLFANDEPDPSGYGEGQYFLGTTYASSTFKFTYPGDLRGKWIAATQTQALYYGFLRVGTEGEEQLYFTTTSEFSRAVEVR